MSAKSIRTVLVFFLVFSTVGMFAQKATTTSALLTALRSQELATRAAAITQIRIIPLSDRDPVLETALIAELQRLQDQRESRRSAALRGDSISSNEDESEYLFNVLDTVADYRDAGALTTLVGFIDTGNRVSRAVAAFGDLAVADLAVQAQNDTHVERVAAALSVFKMMFSQQGQRPLSDDSKRRIADVVRQRLAGNQSSVVLGNAVEVALDTGDRSLVAQVQRLADDPAESRRLGVSDPASIRSIQRRANATLASHGLR